MNRSFPWRATAALLCLLLMPAVPLFFDRSEQSRPLREANTCLGLPILAADMPASGDASPLVLYQGAPAPMDAQSSTLYLSVPLSSGGEAWAVEGTLTADDPAWGLAFAPDPAFADMPSAVAQGHAFRLLASGKDGACAEFSVVFTTLPVISMNTTDGSDYHDPYAGHAGSVYVFEPGNRFPKDSHANWHRRGMTTRLFKKGSWKLTMTNAFGQKRNLSLAGLGADDDWILNSMGMDDLKLREKLIMTLWNGMQTETDYGLRMSDGEYAELVLDGQYMGLYLLQRRVDVKYLGLEKSQDIVLKGSNLTREARTPQEAFTIKGSPLPEEKTYAIAESLFSMDDLSGLDVNNFIDMEIFLFFGALYDNKGFRNAYYVFTPQDGQYQTYILPWDTDLAFGLRYVEGKGYVLLDGHETSLPFEHRREYEAMKMLYPDLDARIAARWNELRSDILNDASIDSTLNAVYTTITQSGAFTRDHLLWGTRYGERDTLDAFKTCIHNRLLQMDALLVP